MMKSQTKIGFQVILKVWPEMSLTYFSNTIYNVGIFISKVLVINLDRGVGCKYVYYSNLGKIIKSTAVITIRVESIYLFSCNIPIRQNNKSYHQTKTPPNCSKWSKK